MIIRCGEFGCLFNIQDDPSEYTNLATSMPEKLKAMYALFQERNATSFETEKAGCYTAGKPQCAADITACEAYVDSHGGFYGPFE